jgi:hypothetical protein
MPDLGMSIQRDEFLIIQRVSEDVSMGHGDFAPV